MRSTISFRQRLLLAALLLALSGPWQKAHAQLQNGTVQGRVTNRDNGRPLAGVTIVITGPSLQGEQTEFSDPSGRYQITELPPGDNYIARFYFNDVVVERPGIRISVNSTLTVNIEMPTQKGEKKAYVIRERAPNVDTASANTGVEINQELLQNTAVRGRSFESVLALAPGAADVAPRAKGGATGADVGVSVSGSVGNENTFIIDGLNTTDVNTGVQGTQLNQYFIKEINIITGGYQAEYGRATGGVVTVITKNGSNEFHGGIFGSWAPFQLQPNTVARLGEALGVRRRMTNEFDFGFDLGGPIVKDRIWFYVGFAPDFTTFHTDRVVRTQTFNPATGKASTDPNFQCPSYLAYSGFCDGPRVLAYQTTEQPNRTQGYDEQQRLYNWIAKLQFNINPDHNITLGYIGSPTTFDGYNASLVTSDPNATKYTDVSQVHDFTARYIGKLLDRKLQLELMYGYHYQHEDQEPLRINQQEIVYRSRPSNPNSLADFENEIECGRTMMNGPSGPTSFNPCPVTSYQYGGFGQYRNLTLQRHVVLASATYFLRLLGNHAWKLGLDFENDANDDRRSYTGTDIPGTPGDPNDPANLTAGQIGAGYNTSGHRIYRTNASGTGIQIYREYNNANPTIFQGPPIPLNYFEGITSTRNYAVYLRDSWNVGFLPGLVLNLGVRWEGQQVLGQDGSTQIAIYDNWAPRIGAAYDFTRKGRSKIYFNYGRFYESIPLDINDRQFSGEGLLATGYNNSCPSGTLTNVPGNRPVLTPNVSGCPFQPVNANLNGGTYGQVQPNIKGQFINEIVAGFQYDVGWDVVLGISYTHRDLGNIIEDMSTDGGNFYIIGNPGSQADAQAAAQLDADAAALKKLVPTNTADPNYGTANLNYQTALSKASAYKAIGYVFPKAVRNYDALTLTANKRLSNRFSVLANYTYSRTIGNYPGTYDPVTGQLDPNISAQFDLVDLLANRNGPLPTDRPHNFKLTGYYVQPAGRKGNFTASLTFTAYSGRPINVLGAHLLYGPREILILPQGSGGRTPTVTQFDIHLGYEHQLSNLVRLNVFWDIINLFNQQAVTNVDDEYTASIVNPLVNGQAKDLAHLKDSTGAVPVANSNFGQPTAYQIPLYMRFGARLSF